MKTRAPSTDIFDALFYFPETGEFLWSPSAGVKMKGKKAGNITHGYVVIMFRGTRYQGHHLAWFFSTGYWPTIQIDHKNLDRSDNRIVNLRAATNSQNSSNTPKRSGCSCTFKGVTKVGPGIFQAQVKSARKYYYLGRFSTEIEAHEAYAAKARELHGEFARLS